MILRGVRLYEFSIYLPRKSAEGFFFIKNTLLEIRLNYFKYFSAVQID